MQYNVKSVNNPKQLCLIQLQKLLQEQASNHHKTLSDVNDELRQFKKKLQQLERICSEKDDEIQSLRTEYESIKNNLDE